MIKVKIIIGTLLLLLISSAQAALITYEFALPSWESNNDYTLFGTDAILQVTVENTNESNLNQTYMNSDIIQVSVNTSGTYSNV